MDHHQTLLERLDIVKVKSCPSFFDNADNMYCCVDTNSVYCCNSTQFFFNRYVLVNIQHFVSGVLTLRNYIVVLI